MGPQLRLGAGGWCINITEYSSYSTNLGWVKITMGHTQGLDWWYRNGVMCTCDCKVLIGYHSNAALKKSENSPGAGITVQHLQS